MATSIVNLKCTPAEFKRILRERLLTPSYQIFEARSGCVVKFWGVWDVDTALMYLFNHIENGKVAIRPTRTRNMKMRGIRSMRLTQGYHTLARERGVTDSALSELEKAAQ